MKRQDTGDARAEGCDPHFHTITVAAEWRTARRARAGADPPKGTMPIQAGGDGLCHDSTGEGSTWQILIY